MNLGLIWLFIRSIPDLVKLLQLLDQLRAQAETDRRVKDDLKALHEAFATKDPDKVRAIFLGDPPAAS